MCWQPMLFSFFFFFSFFSKGVERADVMLHPNGVGKGYGTVKFISAHEASKAMKMANGTKLGGNTIEVKLDKKYGS
jgi:RNA recognition motif-containing protein